MRGSCVEEAGDDPGARPRSLDQIIGTRPFVYSPQNRHTTRKLPRLPWLLFWSLCSFYRREKSEFGSLSTISLILMQEPIPFSNTNSAL